MRELKRSIARANMLAVGFTKLNKKHRWDNKMKRQSVFARNWKKWVIPQGQEARALKKARRATA